ANQPGAAKSEKAAGPDRTATAGKPERTAKAEPAPKAGASVAHGTSSVAVQLAASPNPDDAKLLPAKVQKKFAERLSGFKSEVVTATVAGKTVYRAQVTGFAGQPGAITLCDELKAGGQPCFVRP